MRALVAILIVVFAAAPVLARKATHHRYKSDAVMNPMITSVDRGGTPRSPASAWRENWTG